MQLLSGVAAFASLPDTVRGELAGLLKEECIAKDRVVVAVGEPGDRLYLVVEGRVEVSVARPDVSGSGPPEAVPLAVLGPGELFGEIALLEPGRKRQATVKTLTPVTTLSLGALVFRDVLKANPGARQTFTAVAEQLLIANFLKLASPFHSLDAAARRRLAACLERRKVAAGETIVRQGEPGDTCFLVRSGSVVVVTAADAGHERELATLRSGALFGEAALLTDAPRNATVRALEPSELLGLRRTDLLAAIGADRGTGLQMLELQRLRSRPHAVAGVLAEHRRTPEGETVTILKESARGLYYRLSREGWFLWQRLDGQHTLRDLTLDFFVEFKRFAPEAIAGILGGLADAGFVERSALRADIVRQAGLAPTRMQRLLLLAKKWMEWRLPINGVDPPITNLYRGGIWLLYTSPGLWMMATVAIAGGVSFACHNGAAWATLQAPQHIALWWWLILVNCVVVVFHEAGHAFTTKACGREVRRLGLGWYWHGPIFYVDTSDMWLADRRQRVAVDAGGAGANLFTGGIAALLLWLPVGAGAAAVLYQFTLVSYVMSVLTFNPLLEFDGYHVLSDWLERPNLRPRAMAWLGKNWLAVLRDPSAARGNWLELLYGIASLLYVVFLAALTMWLYHLTLRDWVASRLPFVAATAINWALPVLVLMFMGAAVAADLRGTTPLPLSSQTDKNL